MTCYLDRTFCPFWLNCASGIECTAALTQAIKDAADLWWGDDGAPISVFSEAPGCFVEFMEDWDNDA